MMGFFSDINKLPDDKFLGFFAFFFSLILPGLSILYISDKILFSTLHWISLLFIAIIYSAPIFFLFFILDLFFHKKDKKIKLTRVWVSILFMEIGFMALLFGSRIFPFFRKPIGLSNLYLYLLIIFIIIVIKNELIKKHQKPNKK